MGTGLEIALIALTAASAVGQGVVASNAAEAQEDIGEAQAASQKTQRIEQRRRDVRKRRIAAARIRQSARNAGTAGGSGEAGALGSLATQGASIAGQSFGQEQLTALIARRQSRLGQLNNISGVLQGATDLGTTALGIAIRKQQLTKLPELTIPEET